uniref:Translation initiation factor eIF3 subunit 135, putative n=1 Tax=Theileria annulata TaxID=5874 RepID=A0A3B0MYF9_THEAN
MLNSDTLIPPEANGFFNRLNLPVEQRPVLGYFSNKVYNVDNVEDYLNFSWKFDNPCSSEFEDRFALLENLSDVFSDDLEDKLSSKYDSRLIVLSTLDEKLQEYLYGVTGNDHETPDHSSWNLPDYHPLKVKLVLPGDEKFGLNTNWDQRLQSSIRNLFLFKNNDKLSEFNNDYEYSLLSDVGHFANSCKLGSIKLLNSLIASNLSEIPSGFFEVTPQSYPLIYKFYSPKFKDDRLFVYDGIVFTLVLGNSSSYSKISYTTCKKLYSNDLKGKQALCDAIHMIGAISRFAVPFCCITDYMGFRVVGEPLISLSLNTKYLLDDLLGFDSYSVIDHDGHLVTSSLFENDQLYQDFIKLSTNLRVSSLPVPFGSTDLDGPQDFNNNSNAVESNGTLYFRNTHEVLPPMPDLNTGYDQLYKNRFRQEFSTVHYEGFLKCTLNSQSLFNKNFDDTMFQTAAELNNFVLENNLDKFHTMTSSWDISNTLHSFGINIRNIGKIYENTSHSALKDLLACEMVSRAFKHLWDLELESFIRNKNVNVDLIQELFVKMLNDLLGLSLESMSFWNQYIHPQISIHFNVIDLQSITFKTLPQMLLISAVEYNLGIVIPKLTNGQEHTKQIDLNYFKSSKRSRILHNGQFDLNFYAKVSVSCPKYNLSIFKASSKLCDHKEFHGYGFLLESSSFGMGLPRHIKSKIVGTGYPCNPICSYNYELICSKFNQHLTGINLYCLIESLVQTDPFLRFKLLLTLGYTFLKHRFYKKALQISKFLSLNSFSMTLFVEAKILELQCYCLTGDNDSMEAEYHLIKDNLKNLEGFDGFLNLQVLTVNSYHKWNTNDYKGCISYIENSKESFLHLFSVKNYEWVPVFFLSLLGYCNAKLNVYFDSTKVHHELVRYCNLSNLPTYTKCNLLWLLLESLIRVGSYSHASKISTDLLSILEFQFGPLSMKYLRSLYVSAWLHRQMGSIHFLHPYLYLSNSENLIHYKGPNHWFENQDLIMEELSSGNCCFDKRKHLKKSQNLYTIILDKFLYLSRKNNIKILEIINNIDPNFSTSKLEKLVNITKQSILEQGNQKVIDGLEDTILVQYLDQSDVFQSKIMLVVENYLMLKILSLDTKQYHEVANKLYNAYASQVSSEYTKQLSTGTRTECGYIKTKKTYSYGTRVIRFPESFSSYLSIKKNIIPKSGHDLRSTECLLMAEPEYTKKKICEMCLSSCDSGADFNNW